MQTISEPLRSAESSPKLAGRSPIYDPGHAARIIAERTIEVRSAREKRKPETPMGDSIGKLMPEKVTIVNPDPEAESRRTAARLLEVCGVPKRYRDADLDDCERVPESVRGDYAEKMLKVRRLLTEPALFVLMGKRGTGKTWMGCALVNEFCNEGRRGLYAEAMDYFLALDDARERETRSAIQVEVDYVKPELLVLDAMEERAETPSKDKMLTRLINKRYAALKGTLLITNETQERFAERVGSTISDRIFDGGGTIVCGWNSLRGEVLP